MNEGIWSDTFVVNVIVTAEKLMIYSLMLILFSSHTLIWTTVSGPDIIDITLVGRARYMIATSHSNASHWWQMRTKRDTNWLAVIGFD